MSKTFSWATQVSPSANEVVNLLTSQFGDGYEQVAVNGINNVAEEWELTWTGKKKDVAAIRAFLHPMLISRFGGRIRGGEKLYRVKPDSIKPTFISGKVVSLAFTFKQAFAP